jgi:flagellar basal body-associated protein FliL
MDEAKRKTETQTSQSSIIIIIIIIVFITITIIITTITNTTKQHELLRVATARLLLSELCFLALITSSRDAPQSRAVPLLPCPDYSVSSF